MKPPRPFSALPSAISREASPIEENQLYPGSFGISPLSTSHPRLFQQAWVRSSTAFYRCFNLLMDRSPGFGSTSCYFSPFSDSLFRLAFASAPRLYRLTSQHNVTRRPVLQKVRHHARVALCLLVSTRFQVLFHSPPGVLFTFPSRYYSLSVTWSYLAFGDGPPVFRQDSSCPDVLRIPLPSA